MHHDRKISPPASGPSLEKDLFHGLDPLVTDLHNLDVALQNLQEAGDDANLGAIQKLRGQLRDFEPSVTFIGQVKAGKTSLVNAVTGMGNLLPADVNPWTSVVTSLHLSPTLAPANQHASFRFFAEEEWRNLLNTGGRVGELASRAGADKELEKVRQQLNDMRQKSRARLGASFEQLLGQTHEYRYIDEELIQRYVCLGDEFDLDTNADKTQGRFADITKSADLFVSKPALPLKLCLRDTPGVNDTFMVREQITVNAIRGSRLCIVVLSASQALSTVDLALIRLVANIPTRDVIIFVNRVDELANPPEEIPEIRASILKTLSGQGISANIEIIFGSAHWASHALSGKIGAMDPASAEAMIKLARFEATRKSLPKDPVALVWDLSGLPDLGRAVAERIVSGEGAQSIEAIATGARNVANAMSASRAMSDRRMIEGPCTPVDAAELSRAIDAIADTTISSLTQELDDLLVALDARLEKSRHSFVSRAVVSLIEHLEAHGEDVVWTYDPTGLRLLLRSGYQVFSAKASRRGEEQYLGCSLKLKNLFLENFALSQVGFDLESPPLPMPGVPVTLGQTIALDIKGGWWTRWWRRKRSYAAYGEEFRALVDAEIAPMVETIKAELATSFSQALTSELEEFIVGQRNVFLSLAQRSQADLADVRHQQDDAFDQRNASLNEARSILMDFGRTESGKAQR
ncbi:hypothetical protein A8B78_09670 [Jannaschia sp. EhC01]|nr:hypothetical protein A8B78_09670 [Jannaschia sp. EhC01]